VLVFLVTFALLSHSLEISALFSRPHLSNGELLVRVVVRLLSVRMSARL